MVRRVSVAPGPSFKISTPLLHPYGKYSVGSSNECPPVPWVPCRSAGAGGVGIWSRLPQLANSILLVTIRRRRSFPVCSRLWVLSLIRRTYSPYWVRSSLFYVDIQIFAAPLVYLPAVRYSSCNLQIQQGGEYIKFNLPHRSPRSVLLLSTWGHTRARMCAPSVFAHRFPFARYPIRL